MPPPVRNGPDAPIPGFPASLQPNFSTEGAEVPKRAAAVKRSIGEGESGRGSGRWKSLFRQWGEDCWGKPGNTWQNGQSTGSGCGPDQCKGLPGRKLILPPVGPYICSGRNVLTSYCST